MYMYYEPKKSNIGMILGILLLFTMIGVGIYFYINKDNEKSESKECKDTRSYCNGACLGGLANLFNKDCHKKCMKERNC